MLVFIKPTYLSLLTATESKNHLPRGILGPPLLTATQKNNSDSNFELVQIKKTWIFIFICIFRNIEKGLLNNQQNIYGFF